MSCDCRDDRMVGGPVPVTGLVDVTCSGCGQMWCGTVRDGVVYTDGGLVDA